MTLIQGDASHYRVLVTDINLSGELDGWAVARKARELDPDFPVVYMTGADADKWPINGVPNSILLNKPFTAVSQLLNATRPPPPAAQ